MEAIDIDRAARSGSGWRRAGLACALGASLLLGACAGLDRPAGADPDPGAAGSVDQGLAKLTAVAGGESTAAGTPETGDASALPTPDPLSGVADPLSELEDVVREVEGEGALPGGIADQEPLDQAAAAEEFDVARATQEAQAGIADVSALVQAQPPLATFTPSSRDGDLDGRLLYVRSGAFYTANADGSDIGPLDLEDDSMPTLWTPPEDPGRAWPAPNGERVAFFAGSDAGLWVMDADGGNNRSVHDSALPSEEHAVSVAGASQSVKLRPGQDYTLIYGPAGDDLFGVLIDDNSYHVRGAGRVRVVHAARGLADTIISARFDGQVVGSPMRFGRANGLTGESVGSFRVDLVDQNGQVLVPATSLEVGDRQLLTWFVYGDQQLGVTAAEYPAGSQPTSGQSRVRVFNASAAPIEVQIEDAVSPLPSIAPGSLSPYVGVRGILGQDARREAELSIYGLRAGEDPIAWTADSERLAFVSAADGTVDLYMWEQAGDRVSRITQTPQREVNPRWSPDGASLVWSSVDEGYGQNALHAMSGGQVVQIDLAPVAAALDIEPGRSVAIPYPAEWLDDDTLFFYPYSNSAAQGVWLYDTASRSLRQIVGGAIERPRFSAAARAWVYNRVDDGGRLYRLDADGTESVLVEANAYGGDWSPDGTRVTYGDGISTSPEGWSIGSIDAEGGSSQMLTARLPILQESPPVPGPDAKRFWIDDDRFVFSRVGRDYGRRDREGVTGRSEAGNDIENLYLVSADGRDEPRQLTDMTKAFYINDLVPSPDGDVLGYIGFSYLNRAQQLYAVAAEGGKPVKIDGAVRWFMWLD